MSPINPEIKEYLAIFLFYNSMSYGITIPFGMKNIKQRFQHKLTILSWKYNML